MEKTEWQATANNLYVIYERTTRIADFISIAKAEYKNIISNEQLGQYWEIIDRAVDLNTTGEACTDKCPFKTFKKEAL